MSMINKSKSVLGYIFPSCIFFQCGSPQTSLISNRPYEFLKADKAEDFVNALNNSCIEEFKSALSKQHASNETSWENRKSFQKESDSDKNQRYIDHISTYIQTLEGNIAAHKQFLQLPTKPKDFLIEKAKAIAKVKDSDQQEYWGNLEFYLAGYAASLLIIAKNINLDNDKNLDNAKKVATYKEIIDGFYEAYTTAFELISGIKLKSNKDDERKMDFRTMCKSEEQFKISLFSDEKAGELVIEVGTPIWIMESLALLKKHPVTGKPATMKNLGRGEGVVDAKDLDSAYGLNENKFLLSFCLNFCDYVRQVITDINKLLVVYVVPSERVANVQEDNKFLFKDFREIIDLQKEEILFFNRLIEDENKNYYFTDTKNSYTELKNNLLSFKDSGIDKSGNYDEHKVNQLKQKRLLFEDLLSIYIVDFVNDIISLANKNIATNIFTSGGQTTYQKILLPIEVKTSLPVKGKGKVKLNVKK